MNDRDRLIEIIYCAGRDYDDYVDAQHEIGMSAHEDFDSWLADDLLANGVIVPPVSVGQTVYSFCDVFGVMLPYVIQDFKIGFMGKDRPNCWYWEATSHATETDELLDEIDFDIDDIGKTVFLTKEEAERALKEREEK